MPSVGWDVLRVREACRAEVRALGAGVFLAILASCLPASGAILRFSESVQVEGAVVTLGDVADIYDADAELVRRLRQITLVPAPAAGRDVRIDFAAIRARLLAHGVNLATLEFSGHSVVSVSVAPVRKEPHVVEQASAPAPAPPRAPVIVQAAFTDAHRKQAERLVTEALRQQIARISPELGTVAVSVRLDDAAAEQVLRAGSRFEISAERKFVAGGPQSAFVRFRNEQDAVESLPVAVWITPQPLVLTVRSTVPRGHVLQASDLVWMQVEERAGLLDRFEDALGKETQRVLRKDEPFRADDLRAVPLVRSNDLVTVFVRGPGLTVRRQFKSRGNGALNETIELVSLDGRERFTARVTGYHEAEALGGDTPAPGSTVQYLQAE